MKAIVKKTKKSSSYKKTNAHITVITEKKKSKSEKIPTAYLGSIDTSEFKEHLHFICVVLYGKNESFVPLYKLVSEKDLQSEIKSHKETAKGVNRAFTKKNITPSDYYRYIIGKKIGDISTPTQEEYLQNIKQRASNMYI